MLATVLGSCQSREFPVSRSTVKDLSPSDFMLPAVRHGVSIRHGLCVANLLRAPREARSRNSHYEQCNVQNDKHQRPGRLFESRSSTARSPQQVDSRTGWRKVSPSLHLKTLTRRVGAAT